MPRQTVPSSVLLRGELKMLVPLLRDGVAWRVRNYVTVTSDLGQRRSEKTRSASCAQNIAGVSLSYLIRDLVRPQEHTLHDLGHVAQVERV